MGLLSIIVTAVVGYAFGAIWYMALAKPWMQAAGIKTGPDGRPENQTMTPYLLAAVAMIVVAGMMRHVFAASGIDAPVSGLVTGLGIGLFFISPWIMINNGYGGRPFKLTLIDGGYATFGCATMGLVLGLF